MRFHLLAVRGTPADEDRDDERGDARADVDDGAAREVEGAELVEPAVRGPDPVRDGRVDEDRPEDREEDERAEPLALGEGAGDEGRRDRREHQLERREEQERDRRAVERARVLADAHEERVVEAADEAEAAEIGPEGEAESDDDPDDTDEGQPEEAVHDRREDVLAADEPAIEQGQAGKHDHDQRRRRQHPGGVACVHRIPPPRRSPDTSGRDWRLRIALDVGGHPAGARRYRLGRDPRARPLDGCERVTVRRPRRPSRSPRRPTARCRPGSRRSCNPGDSYPSAVRGKRAWSTWLLPITIVLWIRAATPAGTSMVRDAAPDSARMLVAPAARGRRTRVSLAPVCSSTVRALVSREIEPARLAPYRCGGRAAPRRSTPRPSASHGRPTGSRRSCPARARCRWGRSGRCGRRHRSSRRRGCRRAAGRTVRSPAPNLIADGGADRCPRAGRRGAPSGRVRSGSGRR